MSNLVNIEITNDALAKMKSLGIERESLEREYMYAQRHFLSNPKLENCDHGSVLFSILDALATGITLNPVNQYAYLEPRWDGKQKKNICHFRPMFRGLTYLAIKEGAATSFNCHVVHANDEFQATPSDTANPIYHKVPSFNRGEVVGVYVVAYLPDGRAVVELIDKAESDRILKTSQSPAARSYPNEFRRKTALKRIIKRIAFGAADSPLMNVINVDNQDHRVEESLIESAETIKVKSKPTVKTGSVEFQNCVKGIGQGREWSAIEAVYDVPAAIKKAVDEEVERLWNEAEEAAADNRQTVA